MKPASLISMFNAINSSTNGVVTVNDMARSYLVMTIAILVDSTNC